SNKPNQQTITKHFNDETYPITPTTPVIPQLKLSALAQHERLQYFSWWKDLDPFNIGVLDNESVLHFLKGCHITDDVLEKILRLFDTATDGLKEEQFYAMLRLIGHAQNGRRITPELVHLGGEAPVPRFDVNTIDALIKKPQQQQPPDLPARNGNAKWQPNTTLSHPSISAPTNDPNWWAAQQQQQQRSPNETENFLPPPRMERTNAPGPLPSMPSSAFAQHIPQQVPQFGYNGYVNPPVSPNNGVSPPPPPFPNSGDGTGIPGYMPSKRFSDILSPSDVNFQTFSAPENALAYGTPTPSAPQWIDNNGAWQTSQSQPQETQTAWQPSGTDNLRSWAPEPNTYNNQTALWSPTNSLAAESAPNMLVASEQKVVSHGKSAYGHGRSRSVPHASTEPPLLPELNEPLMMSKPKLDSESTENGTDYSTSSFARPPPQSRPNVSQRASMDPDSFQKLLTKIDRGESLLLTKGLDFDSGKSLNPFRRSATISHGSRRAADNDEGPFADQNTPNPVRRASRFRSDSLAMAFDEAIPDNLSFIHPNARRNKYNLSPPPIPSQLTKPDSLKYARNRNA
ncbi:hypothetical protein INT43_000547, partial [Umbelopsis isabellina]